MASSSMMWCDSSLRPAASMRRRHYAGLQRALILHERSAPHRILGPRVRGHRHPHCLHSAGDLGAGCSDSKDHGMLSGERSGVSQRAAAPGSVTLETF
jgi:hypothetical protein